MTAFLLSSCDDLPFFGSSSSSPVSASQCDVPTEWFVDGGVGRDGIPALNNPPLVANDHPEAQYMGGDMRVIGVRLENRAIAVPHDVLWWHEIANLDLPEGNIAITYCPLTGSALVFDRSVVGGREYGVSGLLFLSNLVMFDRGSSNESLWPQMAAVAACGPERGTSVSLVPHQEMMWREWRELHPESEIIAETATSRANGADFYPYGDYEASDRLFRGFPSERLDSRRQRKERVLGIPGDDGGLAIPFGRIGGQPTVVHEEVDGSPIVAFSTPASESAAAFHPILNGEVLEFAVQDGAFVDLNTGSTWTMTGVAVDGPLAGGELPPVVDSHVAFWFAWAAFHPDTRLWEGSAPGP